ncbi:MAG: holo-ACP synthase [Spirochaetales bacterium]|jgi:holo-[acyl-carrier protein] synthase|nr:holo-ACP synthase [Spirochaetales bacterium]
MKILSGIDIAEVARIEKLMNSSSRFLARCFSDSEITYCQSKAKPAIHFTGRFAAKEAAAKALGLAWKEGLSWKNIVIESESGNAPVVHFLGYADEAAAKLGITDISVSISHCETYAVAHVVAVCE